MLAKYLLIGEIVKPQGVMGEVKVKPFTDDAERFHKLKKIWIENEDGYREIGMRCVRVHDGMVYLRIDDVSDKDAAERWRGVKLYVTREDAVKLNQDENFICDLIGCVAYDTLGNRVGVLKDVLTDCPTDVYVFDTDKGVMMMPALKAAIPEVDVEARRMLLDAERYLEVAVFED